MAITVGATAGEGLEADDDDEVVDFTPNACARCSACRKRKVSFASRLYCAGCELGLR